MCGEGETQSFAGNALDPTSTSLTCMPNETWSQGFTYLRPSVSICKMGIIYYSQESVGLTDHACKPHNPGPGTQQVLNHGSNNYQCSWTSHKF